MTTRYGCGTRGRAGGAHPQGHTDGGTSVAFSADGNAFASAAGPDGEGLDADRDGSTPQGATPAGASAWRSPAMAHASSRGDGSGARLTVQRYGGAFCGRVILFRILVRRHAADFARGGASAGIGGPPDSAAGGRPGSPACADGVTCPAGAPCHSSHSRFNALQTCSIVHLRIFPPAAAACARRRRSASAGTIPGAASAPCNSSPHSA